MKANKFFLGLALIGAILTGCDNGQGPETNGDEAKAYMSVRISMASSAGTRAGDGGFKEGSGDEQKINSTNSIFLFYDVDGKFVTSGQLATQDPATGNVVTGGDHPGDINDYSAAAYIVLSGPDEELKKSTQVLTVVNYSGYEGLKYLNLTEALKTVATTTTDPANAGFLMSTSVYVDGGKIVNTTAIDGAVNIQQTPDLAKANSVDIYIERASAKAQLLATASPTKLTGDKKIVVDGVLSDVKVTITGWTLNNVHESTYLVKQLDNAWTSADPITGWTAWNWAANHRSYWAKGYNWEATDNTGNTVYNHSEATVLPNGSAYMYCYENTVLTPACAKGEDKPNVNTVLIAAKIEVGDADADTWEADKNLYEYAGVFYREDTYKKLIAEQLKEVLKIQKNGADLTSADIVFNQQDGNVSLAGIKVNLSDASATYTVNGATKGKDVVESLINNLPHVKEALGYANGKCFYQIPVEHIGASGITNYGMVRNHWYEINITKINHVGEPVYDPDVEIPEIPAQTQEYYLAAEIHVLSWHVVTQDVQL